MISRFVHSALLVAVFAVLAACDSSPPQGKARAASSPQSERKAGSPDVLATAEDVANEARGKVRCPAKITTPARAKDAPVDDVMGVRPGLTYDEASNIVMCTHDLLVVKADTSRRFNINTFGQTIRQGFSADFAEPRVHKDARDYMRELNASTIARGSNAVRNNEKPGQSRWYVSTMGLPGDERVISLAREEWFEEGRNPTRDSVEQALIKKYGQPTLVWRAEQLANGKLSRNGDTFKWIYDTFGRRVSETSPLYHRCDGISSTRGGGSYSPDCGIVVEALVLPVRDNLALARSMTVGVIDQAGGYEALVATEQALQARDAQRRAREVEEASRNAVTPEL